MHATLDGQNAVEGHGKPPVRSPAVPDVDIVTAYVASRRPKTRPTSLRDVNRATPLTFPMLIAVAALPIALSALATQNVPRVPWWNRAAEAQVGHYRIRTDLPADRANELARHLNVMYDEFSRRLAALPARAPGR